MSNHLILSIYIFYVIAITCIVGDRIDCLEYRSCKHTTLDCAPGSPCMVTCGNISGSIEACMNTTINCASEQECTVYCNRYHTCRDVIINAKDSTVLYVYTPSNGDGQTLVDGQINCDDTLNCDITCTPYHDQCSGLEINAESAQQLILRCEMDSSDHCNNMNIYCPKEKQKCWLFGAQAMINVNIYSHMGFNAVEICGTPNTGSIGTMHCQSGYGLSCAIDASDPNICLSGSLCDDTTFEMTCTVPPPTDAPTTSDPTTAAPVTLAPTTAIPTTAIPTTAIPTTTNPTTSNPTTSNPSTSNPVTSIPITSSPITSNPVTSSPITSNPITSSPITSSPITSDPTTLLPTTHIPTTINPTTEYPTTSNPITQNPTTRNPTTKNPTTTVPTTSAPIVKTTVSLTLTPVSSQPTDIQTTYLPTNLPTTAPSSGEGSEITYTQSTDIISTDNNNNGELENEDNLDIFSNEWVLVALVVIVLLLVCIIIALFVIIKKTDKKEQKQKQKQMNNQIQMKSIGMTRVTSLTNQTDVTENGESDCISEPINIRNVSPNVSKPTYTDVGNFETNPKGSDSDDSDEMMYKNTGNANRRTLGGAITVGSIENFDNNVGNKNSDDDMESLYQKK